MHVEMDALIHLTNEKDMPLEQLIQAIEVGVLTAYNQSHEPKRHAHAKLNRETGEIQILIPGHDNGFRGDAAQRGGQPSPAGGWPKRSSSSEPGAKAGALPKPRPIHSGDGRGLAGRTLALQ